MFDTINSITTEMNGGQISAIVTGENVMGEVFTREYRTNKSGDGLWVYGRNGEVNQLLGTSQFSAKSRRQMRDRLRRELLPA
jgi:hypothetical protein